MDSQIIIENGKIFVENRETTNPTEIGYAIIDAIQEGFEISINKPNDNLDILFKNKDFPVYLKHDVDQLPRMIISTVIDEGSVLYNLSCGGEITQNYAFEMSRTKTFF